MYLYVCGRVRACVSTHLGKIHPVSLASRMSVHDALDQERGHVTSSILDRLGNVSLSPFGDTP